MEKSEQEWISVSDEQNVRTILRSYGDDEKKNILVSLVGPDLTSNVLRKNNISQTSGYRKIKELINDGLIVAKSLIILDGRKFYKHVSVFEDLKINIVKDKVVVKVKINKEAEEIPFKNKIDLDSGGQIAV